MGHSVSAHQLRDDEVDGHGYNDQGQYERSKHGIPVGGERGDGEKPSGTRGKMAIRVISARMCESKRAGADGPVHREDEAEGIDHDHRPNLTNTVIGRSEKGLGRPDAR